MKKLSFLLMTIMSLSLSAKQKADYEAAQATAEQKQAEAGHDREYDSGGVMEHAEARILHGRRAAANRKGGIGNGKGNDTGTVGRMDEDQQGRDQGKTPRLECASGLYIFTGHGGHL